MSVLINETDLPQELTAEQAVEAAYSSELAEVASKVQRGLPALIECDKDLAPYLYLNLRNRLRIVNLRCLYLDGRPRQEEQGGAMPMGLMGTMIAQLREAVRGPVERRIVVLPHLDLLTTSQGGLTAEAREVIPLLYENPELVWIGFKDPSFPLPQVIENLFPHRVSLLGISRNRLRHLITRKESRKFGREFNPWALYKYVSGINAIRLRKLLSTLEGEDYPANSQNVYRQLRQATLGGTLEVPTIRFGKDIGGYAKVKEQLHNEVLNLLARKEQLTGEEQIRAIEELIPKGMIFWGPPGTGKTLFAKAMASEIGAAVTIVSGPELKSKWVGESLPYEEEVFVILNGQPRRLPIGELVEEHSKDDVSTWTVRDDGTAILSPVTGFLRHKGPDYIDVLVTETGREVRVTGGHSLFVERDGKLTEVFAEQIEPGRTRIAVPLCLQAPEMVRELNLLELLAEREDIRIKYYESWLPQTVTCLGKEAVEHVLGVKLTRLQEKSHPPITAAAFHRLQEATLLRADPSTLYLGCLKGSKELPALLPLTEDLGVFLGKWVADGCFSTAGVRLALHEKELEHYEPLCRRLFGHVTCYRKRGDNAHGVDLIISSQLLHRVMKHGFGLRDGSATKRVPPFIFLAPLPVVAAFLRGYFSGDGTFNGKYIEATTVSRGLANDILTLLQYFGIAARVRTRREWNGTLSYRVRFLWTKFLRKFVTQIGFVEPERTQAVCDYLDNSTFQRKLQTPEGHITNDVLWDLVVEKRRELYSREYVYDLSVPETERFIAGFGNVLVHNSEQNLREIFHKARQSAPSIIVFDELDSFASARGTYTGSGIEHSMVNQLLTEMDGFHREEMVFVVGTTNFVEILDPALLRPGRFEFHLHIPYPDADARREIIRIYDRKMALQMDEETLEYTVKRTGSGYLTPQGTAFSGDHINALCRSIARLRLREGRKDASTPKDVERALTEYQDRPKMTAAEERVLATHEAGHAICSLFCTHTPPIERITIESDNPWAFGYVRHQDPAHRYIRTRNEYLDAICVALAAREAESLLLDDLSMGAVSDLETATAIARELVEVHGLGGPDAGIARYVSEKDERQRRPDLSESQKDALDRAVRALLEEGRQRAAQILHESRALLEALRDMLLEKKTIDAKTILQFAGDKTAPKDHWAEGEPAIGGKEDKPPRRQGRQEKKREEEKEKEKMES